MFRILYLSTANQPFSSEDLTELLQKARARNEAAHVTGMLVHSDGDFLQALEGEPQNVIEVYGRISVDRGTETSAFFNEVSVTGTGCFQPGRWASGEFRISRQSTTLLVNSRVKLRYLDAMSALDFLLACSRSQI